MCSSRHCCRVCFIIRKWKSFEIVEGRWEVEDYVVLCYSEAYLKFCQFGYGFAAQKTRMQLKDTELNTLLPYCCEVGEEVFGLTDAGLSKCVRFDKKVHKANVDETVAGEPNWPVGAELCLRNLEERPGSFIVSLSAPLGGRETKFLGVAFNNYVVCMIFVCKF